MFSAKVVQCFDSHLHWQATGDWAQRLNLSSLKQSEDISKLEIKKEFFRGGWLRGFGWDENNWNTPKPPHRKTLDLLFPDIPVAFSRADGHATWVNSLALKKAKILNHDGSFNSKYSSVDGGRILMDEEGLPTGVLLDKAKAWIDEVIPSPSSLEIRAHLVEAMRMFHQSGITHIRDMTCNEDQWNQAVHLDEAGLLKLGVLQNFSAEDPKDYKKALELGNKARASAPPHLKPQSIKIFYDGALGSEGALLSEDYASGSGRGFRLLSPSELKQIMIEVWQDKWDLALHTIGDQAVDEAVSVACELWDQGYKGHLHLEHAEVVRPDTLKKMKSRNLTCHIQPSHWLSDRRWAKNKLGRLYTSIFPWRQMEELHIPFYFGSDSPIESPGIELSLRALKLAEEDGIPPLKNSLLKYHQLNDSAWTPNTYSLFEEGVLKELVFEGEHLI